MYAPFGNPVHQIDQHFWILCRRKNKGHVKMHQFLLIIFFASCKHCVLRNDVQTQEKYHIC